MPRALIVGGGVIGTFHALEAVERGWDVVHFDAEAEPHEATTRSPGALTTSFAEDGQELDLSLKARVMWEELSQRRPSLGLRASGSLVVATEPGEMEILRLAMSLPTVDERGWRLLGPAETLAHNPALRGRVVGSLHSPHDGVFEPRELLPGLRDELQGHSGYSFRGGVEIRDFGGGSVTDAGGRVTTGDLLVICPGARADLTTSILSPPPVMRRVQLQMLQTEPLKEPFPTIVADTRTLTRHVRLPGLASVDEVLFRDPLLGEFEVRFNCTQRCSGGLTVGEARQISEPFDFDLSERPAKALLAHLETLLGTTAPGVVRRWSGVVYECVDGRLWYRDELDDAVAVVTGADQRGITLAPVIARDTFDWLLDGVDSGATRPRRVAD